MKFDLLPCLPLAMTWTASVLALETTAHTDNTQSTNSGLQVGAGLSVLQAAINENTRRIDVCSQKSMLYAPTSPSKDGDGCVVPMAPSPTLVYGAPTYHTGSWGVQVDCPTGKVVTSLCSSGKNPDCHFGGNFYTRIGCSEVTASDGRTVKFGPRTYRTPWWGKLAMCLPGEVVTSVCTSGEDPDCPSGTILTASGLACG